MKQEAMVEIIEELTKKALWEVSNVIDCVPDEMWDREYCDMPLWKHIYHMLHSLDLWMINPNDPNYIEPECHIKDLNNLDVVTSKHLSREEILKYREKVMKKIKCYVSDLKDDDLLVKPEKCEYTRFTLILSQFRHLHSHMGMIMGFIIQATGEWPTILGLTRPIPEGEYNKFC